MTITHQPRAAQPVEVDPPSVDPPFVRVRGLNKTFGAARVLQNVNLDIRPGEIHALVGQNGSGKSTVIKILSGVYTADNEDAITVAGHTLANPARAAQLRAHGLAFVHQNLGLVDECSVVENLRLGHYSHRRYSRRIDWPAERNAAAATLRRLHSDLDPATLVSSLSPSEKGVVAVGRALQGLPPGTGCIVFDESTKAIPREVLPDFYKIVRGLAASGTAIILVSHRLDEVLALAHRVTVLRDGAVVASSLRTADLTEASLAHLMLGRELETMITRHDTATSPAPAAGQFSSPGLPATAAALRVRGLSLGRLSGLDLDIAAGEVVGVTGPTNSGFADVAAAFSGAASTATGELDVVGRRVKLPVRSPRQLIEAGLVLVPEDRAAAGLALDLPAQHNLTLPRTRRRGRFMLTSAWQQSEFTQAVGMLGITPTHAQLDCGSFSGGNQQKIMLAKWLLNDPLVLVLHEPTQAVDVAARTDILRAILAAAAKGVAIVIVSSEAQDLAAACSRVVVLREGRKSQELTSDITAQSITAATYSLIERGDEEMRLT